MCSSDLEGDSDDAVQTAFEKLLDAVLQAMRKLDLVALTKLKIALVSTDRIIGVNYGAGHKGEIAPEGDWKELRKAGPGTDDYALSMLLEPMYLLMGENFEDYADSYKVDASPEGEATSAIFASEPLTEDGSDWLHIRFGEMVSLRRVDGKISKTITKLDV